jgi:hypothetical protein|tara:strand:- start:105 stop:473 length:369 start_codon:yes stop_codon:yes gene_type:complete
MKRLILSILLVFSMPSFAAIGDVYYCNTIKDITINKDGSVDIKGTVTFNFKEDADVIDFGSTWLIDTGLPYKITTRIAGDIHAETPFSRAYFSQERDTGQLFWSTSNPNYIRSFVADCEKFD